MSRRHAFTLIELLVVIAIIALLVTLLVPSLFQAKALAKKAFCLSNLHSIGLAAMTYAAEHNGIIPRGNDLIWMDAFLPYVGSEEIVEDYRDVKIFRCPSYPIKEQTICYVDNAWSFTGADDTEGFEVVQPTSLSTFDRPGSTIYLADNDAGWWRPIIVDPNDPDISRQDIWHTGHLPDSTSTDIAYGRRVSPDRHFDGCNCMYIDGHSDWVRAEDMTVDMWRDNWRR